MLTVEDILSALAGRSRWLDTAPTIGTKRTQQYHGVLLALEQHLENHEAEPRRLRAPGRPTAKGKQSKPNARSGSLSEHAAQCVAGMRKLDNAAIFWIVSSDRPAYDRLHDRLVKLGRSLVNHHQLLPKRLNRKPNELGQTRAEDYVPDLATLALYELRSPSHFASHGDRAAWFGLSGEHWRKIVAPGYGVLVGECVVWYGSGLTHIARKLGISDRAAVG